MKTLLLGCWALVVCLLARGQDEAIVLSPFEVSSAEESGKPPVVLRKRADFLLLQISLVNDTREPEQRRDEVYATLRRMLEKVPSGSRIELFTEEFTLSLKNHHIPLIDVAEKRDTSTVTFYAKIPLQPNDDVGPLAETLRAFVRGTKGEGRTELFSGELGLSIKNPERYRYEVIDAIAADVKRLRAAFGDGFEIVVTGLDRRLRWERASIAEVELYLPFSYEVFPLKGGKMITN